jgi:hypothetical protein
LQFGIREILPKKLFFGELTSKLKKVFTVLERPSWRFRVQSPTTRH